MIGLPGTIDNDISCTDYTIGYDTAMNTALEMIDKLRDTTQSHDRCSVVEVMGRNAGYIALNVAIASGAMAVLLPEKEFDMQRDILDKIAETQRPASVTSLLLLPRVSAMHRRSQTRFRHAPASTPAPPFWAMSSAVVLPLCVTV